MRNCFPPSPRLRGRRGLGPEGRESGRHADRLHVLLGEDPEVDVGRVGGDDGARGQGLAGRVGDLGGDEVVARLGEAGVVVADHEAHPAVVVGDAAAVGDLDVPGALVVAVPPPAAVVVERVGLVAGEA